MNNSPFWPQFAGQMHKETIAVSKTKTVLVQSTGCCGIAEKGASSVWGWMLSESLSYKKTCWRDEDRGDCVQQHK